MEVLEGLVEDLDRSTQVTGTENTITTHIAIFKIGENRVLLNTREPAMIADGDQIKVAGVVKPGQFTALACKNQTTGWISTYTTTGCGIFFIFIMILVSLVMTFFFLPFGLMAGFFTFMAYKVSSSNGRLKKAHILVKE